MDFGLGLPTAGPDASPKAILRLAEGAERIGLAAVWVNERLLRPTGPAKFGNIELTIPPFLAISYDPIETLAFVAARTSRIRLGTSVLLSLLHSPAILGNRLATLDRLSNGRLIAGLGQPMGADEYIAAGVSPQRRGAGFREYIEALRAVWGPDPVRFEGRFYRIPESDIGPKPVQPGGPPMLVGTSAPVSIDRAAAMGVGLNPQVNGSLDGVEDAIRRFRASAEAAGHDPATLPVVVRVNGSITDRPGEAFRDLSGALSDRRQPLTGRVEEVMEDLPRLEALGVDHVLWHMWGGDPDDQLEQMERLLAAR